jgi:preprotein translocase subunit SecD
MQDPAGNAAVFFRLTAEGASKFQTLTRALAHRGAKVHRNEHLAIQLGDFVSRPNIDYRLSPNGLSPKQGIEVLGMTISHARRLAREIRQP